MASPEVVRPRASSGTFQRASVACQSCRLRKVKCDAQSVPSKEGCGPCRRAGHECVLDPLADGRRSVSRKFVDKLQRRIETLEALNHRSVDQSLWRPNEQGPNLSATLTVSSISQDLNTTATALPPRSNDAMTKAPSQTSSNTHQPIPIPTSAANGSSSGATRGESPTFFGATSHPHVVSPGSPGEEPNLDSFGGFNEVGIDLDPNSPHLRDHLIQSFFKYQTLWVDIVDRDSFLLHQRSGSDSRWFSKFLENAMLACGTRLSTSKAVRALGAKYLEWAKNGVLEAMSEPTPANLQGFLLLSEYEVTQGNDRPGWMFCGVACRMLSDLGLHELANIRDAPSEAQESAKEHDLAYSLLSACVAYEGVWTIYLGRPSSIPASVMSIAAAGCKTPRKSCSPWLSAWVGLCVPMAEVSHVLNERSIDGSNRSAMLHKLLRDVEEWHENLPLELTYDEGRLANMDPAGYGLHTQYCKVQILLRQALAGAPNARKRRYSHVANERNPRLLLDDSSAAVNQYALRIARLVVTYREAFGVEKIPSIMLDNSVVAVTVMIKHLNNSSSLGHAQDQMVWLRQLVKSIETVQPHFPIIGRMLDSLRQICGTGPLSAMFQSSQREPTDVLATHELPRVSQPFDLGLGLDHVHRQGMGMESGPDPTWDYFGSDLAPSFFSSTRFGDLILDIPPSDPLISTSGSHGP
ncbi:hypothetical protein GQ53DRAFT_778822 [Thozetella sp. PMI_491]|nr:hypothetical protein GQ53DRAFT_778822 [Thozetella sp. PMI_491]